MEESSDEKRLIRRLRNYRAADYVAGAGLLAVALLVGLLLWPAWYPNPERKYPPSPCKLNLKQIALALHNYHDQYKTFPPAFVNGPDGKPWHSWRVLILPFLGEEKLYAEYRFDEPWNGPRNSLLLKRRPDVFCCFGAKPHISPGHTSYSAIVGDGTAWPGPTGVAVQDIQDGLSNTIRVVEVRDAGIPWLAPDDLSFDEVCVAPAETSGRHPSSWHTGGLYVLLCDGAVQFVNSTIDVVIWRALLTRDGGETVNDF